MVSLSINFCPCPELLGLGFGAKLTRPRAVASGQDEQGSILAHNKKARRFYVFQIVNTEGAVTSLQRASINDLIQLLQL